MPFARNVKTSILVSALKLESATLLSGLWFYIIVFVNAPHILLPSEPSGASSRSESEPHLETVSEEAPDPNTALRGWWRFNATRTEAEGLKASILVIRGLLMTQRFDVRHIPSTSTIDLRASFMGLHADPFFFDLR